MPFIQQAPAPLERSPVSLGCQGQTLELASRACVCPILAQVAGLQRILRQAALKWVLGDASHHQPGLLMRTHSLWQSPLHKNHERTPHISDALVSSPHSPLPSMHLLPSHHTGRNPASANSASRAEDQCPLPSAHHHGRAPAHQHDTSHFKSGPAPGLKPMIPNLSISSPSPAHGSPAHGCHCFLLAKDLRTSLSEQQQQQGTQSCREGGREGSTQLLCDGPVQLVLRGFVVV